MALTSSLRSLLYFALISSVSTTANIGYSQTVEVSLEVENDASGRINNVGTLSMFTYQALAAGCMVESGLEVDKYTAVYSTAQDNFYKVVNGLRNGDETLGIHGAETSASILTGLDDITAAWDPLQAALKTVNPDANDNTAFMHEVSGRFTDDVQSLAELLVVNVAGKYSDPFVLMQADSLTLSIATRQRDLTQQMAKDACFSWMGYHAETARVHLQDNIDLFEHSLTALRDGMPELSLMSAPTPEIAAELDASIARWDTLKTPLLALAAGGDMTAAEKTKLFDDLDVELDKLNVLITDYCAFVADHNKAVLQ